MDPNRLEKVKLLILDVDGVLTDGSITYDSNGEEIKAFSARDGLGLKLLMDAGLEICIATGRSSKALHHRCEDLGITRVFDGLGDKASIPEILYEQTGIRAEQIAAMGDDLPDLPLMKKIGVSIAVADAHEVVREEADMVTAATGGHGAVREAGEAILKAQGLWERILDGYR